MIDIFPVNRGSGAMEPFSPNKTSQVANPTAARIPTGNHSKHLLGFAQPSWSDVVMGDFTRIPDVASDNVEGWFRDIGVAVVTVTRPSDTCMMSCWSSGEPLDPGFRVAVSLRGEDYPPVQVNDRPISDLHVARALALRAEAAIRELHPAAVLVEDSYGIGSVPGDSPAITAALSESSGLTELLLSLIHI